MMGTPSQPPPTARSRYSSGTYPSSNRDALADRAIDREIGPGLAKAESVAARSSSRQQSMLSAKSRFAALLKTLGLGQRETARMLHVDESTIRGWLDERDFKRNPPQWAIDALGSSAHERVAILHAQAANRTGSDG